MIYSINGSSLATVYDIDTDEINIAYDVIGNIVYNGGTPPSKKKLKVMTYNVGEWFEGKGTNVPTDKDALYYQMQDKMISDNMPDILMIEEYWKVFSQTGRTAKSMLEQYFPYIHEQGGNSGYFGRCICSKFPIYGYVVNTYQNEADRYYDSCAISVDGKIISLIVTHLGLTPEDRAPQITELISFLSNLDTFICCGDYNTPYSWTDNPRAETVAELTPFFNAEFNLSNCGDLGYYVTSEGDNIEEGGVIPSGTWRGWIDNISSSSDIIPKSAYVDTTKETELLSGNISHIDHMPFIAELEIE